jgi:KUP system potassium uptake protein
MDSHPSSSQRALALAALGVVYGDIGTSPIYAFRTSLGISPSMIEPANVLGLLSLIIWALVVVVCVKYVAIVLRADNRGEGGVLALSTLVLQGRTFVGRAALGTMGIVGAAMFFADGAITPAISVLSAIEGMEVGWPSMASLVVPLTVLVLIALFRLQSRGSAAIGYLFGPIMMVWFATLGLLGLYWIWQAPRVLLALNPVWAARFLLDHSALGMAAISAVFLAVTGGEALFADLGHFGKVAIRQAWYAVVFPSLALNYLGQGALVLGDAKALENPFFLLAPSWALPALVLLATAATVIASQAVISGVFSVVHQAVRLSYVPRMSVHHFSEAVRGEVFVPAANVALALATILLVLGFRSSDSLAAAYGIAVSVSMVIATLLTLLWLVQRDSTENRVIFGIMAVILVIDVAFTASNLLKVVHGGWVPLLMGAVLLIIMNTWIKGRVFMGQQIAREHRSIRDLEARLKQTPAPLRAPGTAVFLASSADGIPRALWQNLRYNSVLHERIILVTIVTEDIPRVSQDRRIEIIEVLPGVVRIIARAGFMETPTVTGILYEADRRGTRYNPSETTFFVGNESLFFGRSTLNAWEKRLFAFLLRNSRRAASFYGVPDQRLVEFGTRLGV